MPAVALALAFLSACGGSDATPPSVKVVSRVTVSGATTTLDIGQSTTLAAAAFEASGAQIGSPGSVAWSSSATTVATVDQSGRAAGVAAGSATITADIGGVKGTIAITVKPAATTARDTIFTPGINFSPNRLTIVRGATVIFALGFDGIGHDVRFATQAGAPADIPVTTRQYVPRVFTTAGDFAFICPTHPEMTGVITVR